MILKDALEKLVSDKTPCLLKDSRRDWEVEDLLAYLSRGMLLRQVHMLPGVYIAAITERGLMGEVLYRFKPKS